MIPLKITLTTITRDTIAAAGAHVPSLRTLGCGVSAGSPGLGPRCQHASLLPQVRRWVFKSIDLWLVSRPTEGTMKYSDRHLAGLSARPPDRVELIGAGSLGYGTGPSFG